MKQVTRICSQFRQGRDVISQQVRPLAQRMADKRGKQADKTFKRWNEKAKRNTGFEDRAGNFSGNIEQTAGVRSRSDCEIKPN